MKTVIIYVSEHHGNTKKIVDAIALKNDILGTDFEVIEEGKQVWTIRVYGKDQDMSKAPLYEITMDYNPELAMDSGMRM